jgi:hypothetical protein
VAGIEHYFYFGGSPARPSVVPYIDINTLKWREDMAVNGVRVPFYFLVNSEMHNLVAFFCEA